MALHEVQQATALIKKSPYILLIVPEKPSTDAFSSMLALYLTLLKKESQYVDAVSSSHVPKQLQFLPGSSQVSMRPQMQPDVILDIAGPQEIMNVRPEIINGGIRLHVIFPEGTKVHKENLETTVRALPYDLVIICGAADLQDLGTTFNDHTDFFYSTPIINIDSKANNEHYGTVNLVDITAASTTEIVHELITQLDPNALEKDSATALYAGIIAATESFQKPSTTPRSFKLASDLIEKEADREAVIQNLVKTKPLPLIKLTGRVYARLRHDEHGAIFWSILRPFDFQESESSSTYIPDAMKELTNNVAAFNVAFILYEENEKYNIYLVLGKGLLKRRQEIQEKLNATRTNGALRMIVTASSLEEAEQYVLENIRKLLNGR